MNKHLNIEINCGDKTCASSPGNFCRFYGTMRMGTTPICLLFSTDDSNVVPLKEDGGWLMRCEQCLNAEVDDE